MEETKDLVGIGRGKTTVNINNLGKIPATDIAETRAGIKALERIELLFNPSFVGQVQGRLGASKAFLGTISQDEAQFRSALRTFQLEARKFFLGTAQSKQELEGLFQAIPDLKNSDPQFTANMKETRKNMERKLRELEKLGGVQATTPQSQPTTPQPQSSGDPLGIR